MFQDVSAFVDNKMISYCCTVLSPRVINSLFELRYRLSKPQYHNFKKNIEKDNDNGNENDNDDVRQMRLEFSVVQFNNFIEETAM